MIRTGRKERFTCRCQQSDDQKLLSYSTLITMKCRGFSFTTIEYWTLVNFLLWVGVGGVRNLLMLHDSLSSYY